uniref:ionotropic receptor 132 precursor n=1 Tax=Aedes aegypti TaxID=7159 RepID=UPI000C20FE71|nr:ionotropic receptor 132 precursor [Aedes aegypti]
MNLRSFTLFQLLLTSKAILSTTLPSDVVDYSLSVIEYLEEHQYGRFECIFLDLSDGQPFDDQFEKILTSPRIDHVTKYVVNSSFMMSFDSPLPQWPSLILISVRISDVFKYQPTLKRMIDIFNPNTRLMMLFDRQHMRSTVELMAVFSFGVEFTRKLIIQTDERAIFHSGFKAKIVNLTDFIHPRHLFKNFLLNMEGRDFTYTTPDGLYDVSRRWMEGTAQYLNANAKFIMNPCSNNQSMACYFNFLMNNEIDISLLILHRDDLPPSHYRTLFDVVTWTNVIIVPRPRNVNVWEMFIRPFTMEAWIFLAILLVAIELIHFKLPYIFKNEPILLVLCGFERYNLHHASTKEKVIFLAMILYFFLMLNAYETRIISTMTDKPSLKELKSLQEFSKAGMKLIIGTNGQDALKNDSRLRGVEFDESDITSSKLDGINAIYGKKFDLEHTMRMPYNYDFSKQRSRYYTIPETIMMEIGMYMTGRRSGLLELFYRSERMLFEAGLLKKWESDLYETYFRAFLKLTRDGKSIFTNMQDVSMEEKSGILGMDDLLPAWIALGTGLTASVNLFLAEKAYEISKRRE